MGPRYRFLVTPLRRSQSPPSHILLALAHVSSCCLQFLNPSISWLLRLLQGPWGWQGWEELQGIGGFRMGEQTRVSLL